MFKANVAVNL